MLIDYDIETYDGTQRVFARTIKAGTVGVRKLDEMMRCLTASYAQLTGDEIVNSFLNKNAKAHHDLLPVSRTSSPNGVTYSCGDSVYTIVRSKARV
ncbi:hypothetical protein HPTD01_3188 [Halomonas sp. TD01]|nr:hypothetical protein GME_15665 [Halomonas sp. TD01]CAH1044710.1 hypothetical protein HPTD01_3188 [Halomonas sp. TD01]